MSQNDVSYHLSRANYDPLASTDINGNDNDPMPQDNGDNKHVDGRVRGPRRADTGDGRWWRSRGDSDNDDDVEEGRSHPTPLTTATRKLAARLRSAGI